MDARGIAGRHHARSERHRGEDDGDTDDRDRIGRLDCDQLKLRQRAESDRGGQAGDAAPARRERNREQHHDDRSERRRELQVEVDQALRSVDALRAQAPYLAPEHPLARPFGPPL